MALNVQVQKHPICITVVIIITLLYHYQERPRLILICTKKKYKIGEGRFHCLSQLHNQLLFSFRS